jgi:sRNA-binding protein
LKGEKTKLLLACMVHQANKEIATQCSLFAAGPTKEVQRSNAAAQVAAKRSEARKERRKRDSEDNLVRRIHVNFQETSLIKSRNDLVATQLQLYNNNKSSFVVAMGQEAYDNTIIELLKNYLIQRKFQGDEDEEDIIVN